MFRIGVDLGGTKIEAIALAGDGRIAVRRRIATPRHDYHGTLTAIASLVGAIEAETGQRATVGIGMPGAISPATGLVKNANSTWLNGRPLSEDLSALLERPLRFANDANCFALSEASDGAAAGAPCVFGVIVGTGTGGGVVINGQPLTGLNAIAGEWGHNGLPRPRPEEIPGPPCYCGHHGCIETYLSGPGLARDHEAATGARLEPAEIARLAEAGDPAACATLERYEDRMARALASVINVLDPGRDRARGRHVERLPAIRARASDVVAVRVLGPRRHPPRASDARRLERCPRRRLAVAGVNFGPSLSCASCRRPWLGRSLRRLRAAAPANGSGGSYRPRAAGVARPGRVLVGLNPADALCRRSRVPSDACAACRQSPLREPTQPRPAPASV